MWQEVQALTGKRHLESTRNAPSGAAVGPTLNVKRWIVERTLAWIRRNRRLARDYERYARTVAAFIRP
jgi:transposase